MWQQQKLIAVMHSPLSLWGVVMLASNMLLAEGSVDKRTSSLRTRQSKCRVGYGD